MSSKVLPIAFGSTEEAAEATGFVLSLPGISSAAAVQVAVLALLGARHVDKSGRKPALFEATALLCSPQCALNCDQVLLRLRKLEEADVTRATRSFVRSAVRALQLESGPALSAAVSNASAVLLSEHLRRSESESSSAPGNGPGPASGPLPVSVLPQEELGTDEAPGIVREPEQVHVVRASYVH